MRDEDCGHSMRLFFWATLCFAAATLMRPPLFAGDWPQWRCDANRSAATADGCTDNLTLAWSRNLGHPDPAYDHQYRMCADASYAPIAAQGMLFVPSNIADSLTSYDLSSGEERWRFVAEGPIRMASVFHDGRVFAGSDDGFLYCLDAEEGDLLWRVRGVPEGTMDSRMLVNDRLCSRWPVRGAPVVADGTVYFGSGLWPEEGAYVTAVDTVSGRVLWQSDAMSYIREGMSDHGRAFDLGLPPQGYLAVIDGKLAVPSGRSLAAWFDPAGGRMEPYSCFYVKLAPPRGTWFLSGIRQYSVQGGNWFGTRPDALPPVPSSLKNARTGIVGTRLQPEREAEAERNRPFFYSAKYRLHDENLYSEPVLTDSSVYASEFDDPSSYLVPRGHTRVAYPEFDKIVARDLTRPEWKQAREQIALYPEGTTIRQIEFPVLWELRTPLRVMIKAGDRLYAGGQDRIAEIAIPKAGEPPQVTWETPVVGNPVHALVADGRLVIVTDVGNLYCFGGDPSHAAPKAALLNAEADPPKTPKGGYALCLGQDALRAARDLLRERDYRVIVLEPDADQAHAMRHQLARDGVIASSIQVVHQNSAIRLTPYWASLVHIGDLTSFDNPADVLATALDALRPFTGQLRMADAAGHGQLLDKSISARDGYRVEREGQGVLVKRIAPPDGSAAWTHEAGSASNTYSSPEHGVRWPLATLWYSGEIDREFTPASHFQHERNPYPLVANGRMFIITHENLHAVDIYTGRYLWHAEMPVTEWVAARSQDSRIYGRPVDRNYVATDDAVYVILEEEIYRYRAEDGTKYDVMEIPESIRQQVKTPRWTEVRIVGDLLYAVLGDRLVAMDRNSGEVLWQRQSSQSHATFAVGDGKLIGLDFTMPSFQGGVVKEPDRGVLYVLDALHGQEIWKHEVTYAPVPEHEVDHPRPWLLPPGPEVAYNAKHGLIVLTARRNSVQVFRAKDGGLAWQRAGSTGNVQRFYSPVVTEDHLVLSQYNGFFAYVLDITDGDDKANRGIPSPRTCARVIGNDSLLVYRDAATELYDVENKRMIGLNSVRSGCTTSFIPAGGILTAPMLGHGCVCNYPMFASEALFHWPEIESCRPAAVAASWTDQAALPPDQGGQERADTVFAEFAGEKADLTKLQTINSTLAESGDGVSISTKDENAGYAVQAMDSPLQTATFRFAVRRLPRLHRHGNAFFVLGDGDQPEDWIECRLYYGGRSSLMIAGAQAELNEQKVAFTRRDSFVVTVKVDCQAKTVAFAAGGQELTGKITGDLDRITHFGYGGANADNVFSAVRVDAR